MAGNIFAEAKRLAEHIESQLDFRWRPRRTAVYSHMGAVLTDAVLQAGVSYRSVVLPRVQRMLRRWPLEGRTTSGLGQLIEVEGPYVLLKWRHPEKPRRLTAVVDLLHRSGVDDEQALAEWFSADGRSSLLALKGFGPKTADYVGMLVGSPAVPVDRHIRAFVREAGVSRERYEDVQVLVEATADLLSVDRGTLDASIWSLMSTRRAA